MEPCLFCGSTTGPATTEHVIPKWATNAFKVPGALTLYASERVTAPDLRRVDGLARLSITLERAICEDCNNGFLSRLENAVRPILAPMMVQAKRTDLDVAAQKLLATWAVKTVLLFELAVRQHYPDRRKTEGYLPTAAELAWLRREQQPPPRSMVWIGCWDCQHTAPITYEPSTARVPAANGEQIPGHLTTFAIGYVVFQVFTVDFLAVESAGGGTWNSGPPPSLRAALPRIWPTRSAITWPPTPFPNDAWDQIVTWDSALKPRTTPQTQGSSCE